MTPPSENNPPTIEMLLEIQQSVLRLVEGISDGQKSLADRLTDFFQEQTRQGEAIENLATIVGDQAERVNGLTEKVDGLTNDIAMVKGGHAVSAMRRNAALIADDLGCQLIEELPQGVVIGFAKVAADNGEPDNEVDSFRHADMVMHVRDANGHPGYVAVEASFTVNANDVRRAVRNAGYLQKYTGVNSYAVVAGVDVLPEALARINHGEAALYRIQPRELQPLFRI